MLSGKSSSNDKIPPTQSLYIQTSDRRYRTAPERMLTQIQRLSFPNWSRTCQSSSSFPKAQGRVSRRWAGRCVKALLPKSVAISIVSLWAHKQFRTRTIQTGSHCIWYLDVASLMTGRVEHLRNRNAQDLKIPDRLTCCWGEGREEDEGAYALSVTVRSNIIPTSRADLHSAHFPRLEPASWARCRCLGPVEADLAF